MSAYEFFCTVMGVNGVVSTLATPAFMFVLVRDQMGRRGDARSGLFRFTRRVVWAMAAVAAFAGVAAVFAGGVARDNAGYVHVLAAIVSVPVFVSALLFAVVSLFETRRAAP